MIDIPGRPGFDGVAFANGFLVMSHAGAGTVDVFSLPKRRLVAQISGMSGPTGIAVDEPGTKMYIANSDGNNITVVSTSNWQVLGTIPLQSSPQSLLFAPDSERLYVAHAREGAISSVELAHGNRIGTVGLGGQPEYLAYDAQRKILFATLQDQHEVVAIDPSMRVAGRYKLAASQPTGLAFDAKARRLYVAVRSAVIALDAATGAEVDRVATAPGTDMLWFDNSSGTLYAAAAGSISVISTGSGKLENVTEVNTDVRGHVLAFDPSSNLLYMPGGREGRSKLLILKRLAAPQANTAEQVAQKGAATTPRQ